MRSGRATEWRFCDSPSRTRTDPTENSEHSRSWQALGWPRGSPRDRAGFNNVDPEYFQRVASAYAAVVGGAYYVYQRRIRSGSLLHELDVQNMAAFRESPLVEMVGARSAAKRVPSFVWGWGLPLKRLFLQSLYEG